MLWFYHISPTLVETVKLGWNAYSFHCYKWNALVSCWLIAMLFLVMSWLSNFLTRVSSSQFTVKSTLQFFKLKRFILFALPRSQASLDFNLWYLYWKKLLLCLNLQNLKNFVITNLILIIISMNQVCWIFCMFLNCSCIYLEI